MTRIQHRLCHGMVDKTNAWSKLSWFIYIVESNGGTKTTTFFNYSYRIDFPNNTSFDQINKIPVTKLTETRHVNELPILSEFLCCTVECFYLHAVTVLCQPNVSILGNKSTGRSAKPLQATNMCSCCAVITSKVFVFFESWFSSV